MNLKTWTIAMVFFAGLEIYAQLQISLRPTRILAPAQPGGPDRIQLTNTASRTVVAFSIPNMEGSGFQTLNFYPPAMPGIAPGAVFEVSMPRRVTGKNGKATLEDYTPSAVLFADGASDGDAAQLRAIDQMRTGNADELERLMPLLNAVRTSSDERTAAALQACAANTAGRLADLYKTEMPNPLYNGGRISAANSVKRACDEGVSIAGDRGPSAARDRISRIVTREMSAVATARASRLKGAGK